MKPIAEQIETVAAPAMALVRKAVGDLREAELQLAKSEKRLTNSRETHDKKRLALGAALVELRPSWPARGPKAKGWGYFLASVDIDDSTARRYMELAGYVEVVSLTSEDVSEKLPTYAEIGMDNRPRKGQREREEQPDDPEIVADREAVEEAGRVEIVSAGSEFKIALGDWHIVLADVDMVDAIIVDPPYGKRTHEAVTTRTDGVDPHGLTPDYDHWTIDNVNEFVSHWAPRCRGWMVALTSDDLIPAWRNAYEAEGRTSFAPVACVIRGMSNRKQGDGPASWTVYAMVSRPKALYTWGTTPGAYVGPRVSTSKSGRGKPPWLMENLVLHYTRAMDTVCDPMAGYGETLLAAHKLRRKMIGAELVDTARREAIIRFHARKGQQLSAEDLATYVPKNDAIEPPTDDTKAEQAA